MLCAPSKSARTEREKRGRRISVPPYLLKNAVVSWPGEGSPVLGIFTRGRREERCWLAEKGGEGGILMLLLLPPPPFFFNTECPSRNSSLIALLENGRKRERKRMKGGVNKSPL